jgi:hypothetical protein
VATYPYVQARYDFGVRKGPTLGLMLHGSESESGLVGYLTRDPARNVSANFVCERTGRMVQMLDIDHASGSLNPQDRSSDKAYYGHQHLVDVLGQWWTDPNSAVISVEIEMYAAKGPNDAQVASLIDWGKDMRQRFPSIRGALGHADQTDTKGCPGSTPAIKAAFAGIGGHGLFTDSSGDDVKFIQASDLGQTKLLRLPLGTPLYGFDGTEVLKTPTARDWDYVGLVDAKGAQKVVAVNTNKVYADGVPRPTLLVAKTGTLVDAPAPVVTTSAPQEYPVVVAVTVGGKPVTSGKVVLP